MNRDSSVESIDFLRLDDIDGPESVAHDENPSGEQEDGGGIDGWELALALESLLCQHDSCTLDRVLSISNGRRLPNHLRAPIWQLCLDVDEYTTKQPLVDIYDLPEQELIRGESQKFVETLSNTEPADRLALTSDLESILTSYSKSASIPYTASNGWLSVLRPLLSLRLTSSQLYTCFRSILRDYVPRDAGNPEGLPFHIFRLLLLYHEPGLCSTLDSKRVTGSAFAGEWFRSLFSTPSCNTETIVALWDIYFQLRDPFLVFHMVLALVINAKDQVQELYTSPTAKEEIISLLSDLSRSLQPDDIPDFVTIAQHYAISTPNSYRRMFESALFGSESFLTFGSATSTSPSRRVAMHSLCMPVSAEELLQSIRVAKSGTEVGVVRFFVVDCRPPEQYNAGHLPTAFHLDCGLMLSEPLSFSTAVQGLLLAQKEAQQVNSPAGGEHLCFLGSGHEEEDQYVNMVVSSFLQRSISKVSLLSGGYHAIHELLQPDDDSSNLAEHDSAICIECKATAAALPRNTTPEQQKTPATRQAKQFLQTVTSWSREKTDGLKGKLLDYIVSPQGSTVERHVRSGDKEKSRPYRGAGSVFSLGESASGEGEEAPESVGTRVHTKAWLKRNEILGSYQCSEVMSSGEHYVGFVAVTATKLYFLRETDERDISEISLCRLLSSVVKITSKKKHPELITFKYGSGQMGEGVTENDTVLITHCDRFYLAHGTRDFVALVKKQIDAGIE